MSNAPRLSLPFGLGAGRQITEQTVKKLHDYVEKTHSRGYFPVGHNTLWHGGVHLYGNEGEGLHALWDGVIVAARLAPAPQGEQFGSPNFILMKHTVRGAVLNMYSSNSGFKGHYDYDFYALYMHLGHEALAPANTRLLDIPWLAPQEAFEIAGSVGVGGKNKKADVTVVQTMLNLLDYDAGVIDGLPGRRTYGAIETFQARFMTSPDSRIDVGGRSWDTLIKAVAGAKWPVDDGFDDDLLGALAAGEIIEPNRRVCGGDKLWTVGPGGADSDNFLFHWEIFSEALLFNRWAEVDGGEGFTVDTRKMFEQLEGADWIAGDGIITPKQVTTFYREHDKAANLRKVVVKFPSEWSVAPGAMLPEFSERFEQPGDDFEAQMAPYTWYTEELAERIGLPSATHYHYNPIEFAAALHEAVVASLPKIEPPAAVDDGPVVEPEPDPEPVVEDMDCNALLIPGHDSVVVLDDDQFDEVVEQFKELDALIEQMAKASNQADKDEAAALLRDKASVKTRADKAKGVKQKGGVAEVITLTTEKPEIHYIPWEWIDFKVGKAGSEIEMFRKRGRGAAWISLSRPDLKDKSLKKRWGDWSGLEKDLQKWSTVQDTTDDDAEALIEKRAGSLTRKLADSVSIWSKQWSKEGSVELAAGKVEVKTDTYDGSAEAAFMRLAGKATGKAEVSLTKLELSGKLEGSFNIAEARVTVNSYTPDRDGAKLALPKDILKGWKDPSNLVSVGRFRTKLNATLEGSVGATVMVGGAVSFGISPEGEPSVTAVEDEDRKKFEAGASLDAKAFAGARGAARIDAAFEWQHPDLKHLDKKFRDEVKSNDNFFMLAKTGVQGEASVGIGAELNFSFGYNPTKKLYELVWRAGLTVGVGLGGELLFEIQVDKIWMLCDIIYLALREMDLKTLVFVSIAAFYSIIALTVAAVLYTVVYGVANLVTALGETLLEGGKALYEAVFGGEALTRAEKLADNLRKTALANPGYFMTLLPDARGKILDLLCQSSAMSDEENIEDAVLFVLYPITTRREYERVLEGLYKAEKHKDDFLNNRKIKLKDRGAAQTHAEDRLTALLDGNEQDLFDAFVRDLASGAPKATPRRPLDEDFIAKAMGLQVARGLADDLDVGFTGKSNNPADFRLSANAKIKSATWKTNGAVYIHDTVEVTIVTEDIMAGAVVAVEVWDSDFFADDYIQTNKAEIGPDGRAVLRFKLSAYDGWEDVSELFVKVRCAGLYRSFSSRKISMSVGKFTTAKWAKSSAKMWDKVDLVVGHEGIPEGTGLEITFWDSDWGPDDKLQSIKAKAGPGGKTTISVEISHHDGGASDNNIYPAIKTLDYTTGETGARKLELAMDFGGSTLTVAPPKVWDAKWDRATCERFDETSVAFKHSGLKAGTEVSVKVYEKDLGFDDLLFTAKGKIGEGGTTTVPLRIEKMDLGWAEGDNVLEFTLVCGTFYDSFGSQITVRVPRITSGSWSKSKMALGEEVGITIHGKGFKDATKATITIWEDDVGVGGDDSLKTFTTSWKNDRLDYTVRINTSDGEWEGGQMECYFQVETDGFEKTFDGILLVDT